MSLITPGASQPYRFYDYDLAVFIERCSPPHKGHSAVEDAALSRAKNLLRLRGSSDEPRSIRNPFTSAERATMLDGTTNPQDYDRVLSLPLFDWTYADGRWIKDVQAAVETAKKHFGLGDDARVALVGHQKDGTSFYLKLFPQWGEISVGNYRNLSATPIREAYFLAEKSWEAAVEAKLREKDPTINLEDALHANTIGYLSEFVHTAAYADVRAEYEFFREYRKPYENLPYGIIFQTVDAVVVQSGHVLAIERRARPGKGLWALPGGFLNPDEEIDHAVYRELREETKIRVPEPVLRGSTIERRRFSGVHRSGRGRTITEAFHIRLADDVALPKVKGADDARRAKWIPLSDIRRDNMFDDHAYIINAFTNCL